MRRSLSERIHRAFDTVATVAVTLALTLAVTGCATTTATPVSPPALVPAVSTDPDADRCRSSGGVWRNNACEMMGGGY